VKSCPLCNLRVLRWEYGRDAPISKAYRQSKSRPFSIPTGACLNWGTLIAALSTMSDGDDSANPVALNQ
jgi:hypothetical protein